MFCWWFKCGMFARKNVTNIAMRDGIFHHTYHDWPSYKSNVEAMVTNDMRYSLKYASIWMMILRNHFHIPSVAEMWFDNKKKDWKLNFLVDFTSRSQKYPSATNMIVIWTSYSDSFTPKTSHKAPKPFKYLMWMAQKIWSKVDSLIFGDSHFEKIQFSRHQDLIVQGTPSKIYHYDPL